MPITVNCSCGKSFTVGDEFAGRAGKCKGCGVALVVPAPADTGDVELLDDEPVAAVETKPAPKKAAVVVEEEPAKESGVVGAPKAAKKRKKKKKRAGNSASTEDEVAKVIAYEARVARTVNAVAYIALGLVILGGAWYMWSRQKDAVDEIGGQGRIGLILLLVLGVAAVGKGLFGMFFGHFFQLGDED